MPQVLIQFELDLIDNSLIDVHTHLALVVENALIVAEKAVEASLWNHTVHLELSSHARVFFCQVLHQIRLILVKVEVDVDVWRDFRLC